MSRPTVVGLFAGIGGIELGLHEAGFETTRMCEIDSGAAAVLETHFRGVPIDPDVRRIKRIPRTDVLTAGFPCQDLSQAGRTAGIRGKNSGLIGYVFDLLEAHPRSGPRWLLIENVPFMLQLNGGRAMHYLTRRLEELGFRWAYRIVDARSFGLPQRRQRVILLASRKEDPRGPLLSQDVRPPEAPPLGRYWSGFYWTEGTRGLGWAIDAVPTLKGGSSVGIPSPPGIWTVDGSIVVPEIRDAERLQGFRANWTLPAVEHSVRKGLRWKLVGNAVSVPVAKWIGRRLLGASEYDPSRESPMMENARWPVAAWGEPKAGARSVSVSMWPMHEPYRHLDEFLEYPTPPLSERATAGFYSRITQSSLRFPPGFVDAIAEHLRRVREKSVA